MKSFKFYFYLITLFFVFSKFTIADKQQQEEEHVTDTINLADPDDPEVTDFLYLDIHERTSSDSQSSSNPLGTIVIGLFGTTVPKTVENFKGLSPFYQQSKTLFHRVIPDFVIQAGDIDGNGGHSIFGEKGSVPPPKGSNPDDFGPYYSGLVDENFIVSHNKIGRVSVANAGKNTGGSQFFICLTPQLHLDGEYVVFGQVLKGMDVALKIASVDRDDVDKPINDIFINSSHVESKPGSNNGKEQDSTTVYLEDHPSGLGGSYHHYVFLPFTIFFAIAGLMAYRNRRNVSSLIRGPRYRRVAGINV